MALRLKHSESIPVGKEGLKFGGSFSLISDELGRLEGEDIKRNIGSVKDGLRGKAHNSIKFIGRMRSQLGKIAGNTPGLERH